MTYKIICMLGGKQIVLRENITEKEVCEFQMSLKKIFEFMNEIDNYTMVQENAKDFLNYAKREAPETWLTS